MILVRTDGFPSYGDADRWLEVCSVIYEGTSGKCHVTTREVDLVDCKVQVLRVRKVCTLRPDCYCRCSIVYVMLILEGIVRSLGQCDATKLNSRNWLNLRSRIVILRLSESSRNIRRRREVNSIDRELFVYTAPCKRSLSYKGHGRPASIDIVRIRYVIVRALDKRPHT